VDGRLLDAQIQALLRAARLLGIRDEQDVGRAREVLLADCAALAPPLLSMAREEDLLLDAGKARLRARLYVPSSARPTPPLLVFFHGGGFVLGSIESHDRAVRVLAEQSAVAVLSVEYRLAPEHKAPTAIEDGYASYLWAREHARELGVDGRVVAVGGDSAGANISASLCHLCGERGQPAPSLQLLIYPAVDLTQSFPSHRTFASGYVIDDERVEWFLAHYVADRAHRRRPELSPWFRERLDGLPRAVVVTAGFDSLHDEARAYADRLRDAGVSVAYRCESSLTHGFFNMGGVVREARAANRRIAADLRRMLPRP